MSKNKTNKILKYEELNILLISLYLFGVNI